MGASLRKGIGLLITWIRRFKIILCPIQNRTVPLFTKVTANPPNSPLLARGKKKRMPKGTWFQRHSPAEHSSAVPNHDSPERGTSRPILGTNAARSSSRMGEAFSLSASAHQLSAPQHTSKQGNTCSEKRAD